MRRLLILGNGFDKAHGIACDYSDFGHYLEENNWPFYENISNAFQQNNHLWMSFEAVLPDCATYIEESGLEMGEQMLSELDYDPCNDMSIGYWLKEQYDFIEALPEVLRDWAEQIDVDKKPIFAFNEDDVFFTFNYTDTVEKVYDLEDVLHIHGDVSRYDLLIMGHGYERGIEWAAEKIRQSQMDCLEYAESTYRAVKAYLESTLKETDLIIDQHQSWFDDIKGRVDEIYIIGHSLGEVDTPYFKKIHDCVGENVPWYLCYHKNRDSAKEQKLINIGITNVKSISQNELYF